MSHINLLPWREERRKLRKQQFLTALGATAFGAILCVGAVSMYFDKLIDNQNRRNAYLESEIAALDTKIKKIQELEKEKASLIARMRAIETLQTSRPLVVHMFDELVTSLPEGIYLNSIQQNGERLTLTGTAQSNARVSNFMRNLEASEWLTNARLEIIETQDDRHNRSNQFTLHINQVIAEPEDELAEETQS